MKDQAILEAALSERKEYLEDLVNSYNLISVFNIYKAFL